MNIDLQQDIVDNNALKGQNAGFDDLVISNKYMKIVKALVKSHTLGSRLVGNEAMDKQQIHLVRGKGKGLIILLHGVPEFGKTPLFSITCGDIG